MPARDSALSFLMLFMLAAATLAVQRPAPVPAPSPSPQSFIDAIGRRVPVTVLPRSVVYLGPPRIMGAYLQATAAPGSLVAASGTALDQFSLWIASSVYPDVLRLPTGVTGRLWTMANLERLLALKPAAVVAWLRTEMLERVGLPVVHVVLPVGPPAIAGTYRVLADIPDRSERIPDLIQWRDSAEATLAGELDAASLTTLPSVLAVGQGQTGVLWAQAGGENGVTGLIRRAGGRNVVAGNAVVHRLNVERVLALDPDVIVLDGDPQDGLTDPAQFISDPRWRTLRAVAQNRVYARPRSSSFYFDDLLEGPLNTRWLAELLHPDRVQPMLRATVRQTYEWALGYTLSDAQIDRAFSVAMNRGARHAARFEAPQKDKIDGRP